MICKFGEVKGDMTTCSHESMTKTPIVPNSFCSQCRFRSPVEESGDNTFKGLGDVFAAVSASVGITKDRVQKITNLVGIKDCGCSNRQDTLNKIFPFTK